MYIFIRRHKTIKEAYQKADFGVQYEISQLICLGLPDAGSRPCARYHHEPHSPPPPETTACNRGIMTAESLISLRHSGHGTGVPLFYVNDAGSRPGPNGSPGLSAGGERWRRLWVVRGGISGRAIHLPVDQIGKEWLYLQLKWIFIIRNEVALTVNLDVPRKIVINVASYAALVRRVDSKRMLISDTVTSGLWSPHLSEVTPPKTRFRSTVEQPSVLHKLNYGKKVKWS
ncbi:hypothetical protein J6590_034204 [Homalodisca vitripennis]|nr:hypothetical protein J6590_034204 [Homalodisca vitripennis]